MQGVDEIIPRAVCDHVPAEPPANETRRTRVRPRGLWPALAAAAVMCVALGGGWVNASREREVERQRASREHEQAIEALAAKYQAAGKRLQLRHLSRDCHRLLARAGQLMVDSDDDPQYEIAANYSVRTGILAGGH